MIYSANRYLQFWGKGQCSDKKPQRFRLKFLLWWFIGALPVIGALPELIF